MRTEKRRKQSGLPLPDKTQIRSGRESEEGVLLLLWRLEFPALDAASEKTDAASFYSALAKRTEKYLTGGFADLLRAAYLSLDPARRRFTFRCAVYRHDVKIARDGEKTAVVRTLTLTQAGRVLLSRVFRETWSGKDGSLLCASEEGEKPNSRPEKPAKKSRKKVDERAHDML